MKSVWFRDKNWRGKYRKVIIIITENFKQSTPLISERANSEICLATASKTPPATLRCHGTHQRKTSTMRKTITMRRWTTKRIPMKRKKRRMTMTKMIYE